MSVDPEGTPDTGNSPAPDAAAQENWEQRFKDTQAAFTQSQQELKALQRLANGEDPDALQAVLDKYGYEVADDEPEPDYYEPDQPAVDPLIGELANKTAQFEEWQQQQIAIQAEQQFNTDLKETAGSRDVPQQGRDWILNQTLQNGANREALEQAAKAWFEFEDSLTAKKRPRAPHVPAGGQPATGGKDPADMTPSERLQWQMDMLNASQAI